MASSGAFLRGQPWTRMATASGTYLARRGTRASFGSIRKLPSGRYQARYTGPDEIVRRAPVTFDAKMDAEAWLATMRADIVREVWNPAPERPKPLTFKQYSEGWLAARTL